MFVDDNCGLISDGQGFFALAPVPEWLLDLSILLCNGYQVLPRSEVPDV
jgi:hypothetical protein